MSVSRLNQTSALLAGDAPWTGSTESLHGFSSVSCSVYATANSGSLSLEFSHDGSSWDFKRVHAVADGVSKEVSEPVLARFFRAV